MTPRDDTSTTKGKDMDEARLARIESKLDKLADGITELARLDERIVTLFNRADLHDQRHEKLQERISAVERVNTARGPFFVWAERIAIALIGAAVTMALKGQIGG